jgi:uncharacterized repeat protein (TIGR03803 family)
VWRNENKKTQKRSREAYVKCAKRVLFALLSLCAATPISTAAASDNAGATITILHSFGAFTNGANPQAPLVLDRDGNFYGGTFNGGAGASGTLFQLSIRLAPSTTREPPSRLEEPVGSVLALSAAVNGMPPLIYQWQMDGINVSDGGNVSGSMTGALTFNPVLLSNTGNYRLIVSNTDGAVTSAATALTVSTVRSLCNTDRALRPTAHALLLFGEQLHHLFYFSQLVFERIHFGGFFL